MATISCDDLYVISCVTCMSPIKTIGFRLSHYGITAYVSTCDAWSPHVIYFTSAIRCNSLVFILEGFKHGGHDHNTRQDGWQWRSLWSHGDGAYCDAQGYTIHNIIWLYARDVYFPVILLFYIFHMVDMLLNMIEWLSLLKLRTLISFFQ
jgi:hypothetical protein